MRLLLASCAERAAHRDPWDRVLENCALVSVDKVFDASSVASRW